MTIKEYLLNVISNYIEEVEIYVNGNHDVRIINKEYLYYALLFKCDLVLYYNNYNIVFMKHNHEYPIYDFLDVYYNIDHDTDETNEIVRYLLGFERRSKIDQFLD